MRGTLWIVVLSLLLPGGALAMTPALFEARNTEQLLAAVAKLEREGGTIRLHPGEYLLKRSLHFKQKSRIHLIGSGWNTTLRMTGKGDALIFEDCGFCVVRDLMVVGGAEASSGIVFRGKFSSSNTVDFCRIADFPVSGIRFEGDPESPLSSNTVSRCHLIGNLQDQLYSLNNNDFYILQNQFGTHGRFPMTGAKLIRSSAGTYSLNYHWGNEVAFYMGEGSHFNRISSNRFENARKEAVILGGDAPYACMLTIFHGNTVHTSSESEPGRYAAVSARNVVDMTFTSNQVFSWDSARIKHRSSLVLEKGCRNWIIKDNIFRHNVERSLVCEEDQGHIVRDNNSD